MTTKESATISSPIKTLNDLLDLLSSPPSSSFLTNHYKRAQLVPRHTSPRQKILLCHDMKGGYLEDKHIQGCQTNEPCYRFFRWHLIDIFIYFSHELVTIPPVVWIDCAHKNGVQILGTFITEFDDGKEICRQLLASDDNVDRAADALALLMACYNFDGYLLNIENPIEPEHMQRLHSFVSKLKAACAKIDPNSLIIWYDSVTKDGELKWQNQLNELNELFFNVCDGIFLNYTWKPEMLLESKITAGKRCRDVFVGIDVFGRGCFGGGGFNTREAMTISYKSDLSTAIFAPGWVFETLDANEFLENDRKFWNSLEPFTSQRVLHTKSLTTFFSDGFGKQFFVHGLNLARNLWYNLSLQSYLPNVLSENQWLINHDDAYFGGSCIEFKTDHKGYFKLFKCLIPIELTCDITVAFKSITDIVLELKFDDERQVRLEKSDADSIIRNWKRKTYRITVNERVCITDVSIHCAENTDSTTIKLGYLSIRPVEPQCLKIIETLPPLIQSIEETSNSSIILHFLDSIQEQPTSIILVFVRDQFEQYSFLGATRQSYFVIFQSEIINNQQEYSMLAIRHYSLDSLDLINEQILKIPKAFDCLQGFCSKKF
ncbi:unnamed protein product [Rotaria magnacalcarata]|uniref:Cytosolic endo-beta-N-acetylglucosaminidase n=1 Tax=Rotaria magnacalcarata TaxID=392030 RepID=A0A816QAP5_9BILA|nr:unnamed protein product [Rotaria magnacalcarata]CAF3929609.1 unnamed protein product [Rotaria magnacalcarata]